MIHDYWEDDTPEDVAKEIKESLEEDEQ